MLLQAALEDTEKVHKATKAHIFLREDKIELKGEKKHAFALSWGCRDGWGDKKAEILGCEYI